MGNRVMERPNLSGGTVKRHLIPKVVRHRRKRALRRATGARQPAKGAQRPKRKRAPRIATKAPKPVKPAERPSQQQAPRIAAKIQKPAAPEQTQRADQELVADEATPVLIDTLQDGAIEWGIKREGPTGSGT